MYEMIIKNYLNKLTIDDINLFAKKNNIPIKDGEDIIIYNFIKNNWEKVYNEDDYDFSILKGKISDELLNNINDLYNKYKVFKK